jgi:hypothetical protein
MGHQLPSLRISLLSKTSPEEVYDALADLRTHLEWGGTRRRDDFRLLTLEAPAGQAVVGTVFSSTGTFPMSSRRWRDRSVVAVADRPVTFEFTTEGTAGERDPMTARYRHHYAIAAEAGGTRITYTLNQLAIANPMLRETLPGLRQLVWRVMLPMLSGRGVRNLLAYAEERAAATSAAVGGHAMPPKEA